MKIFKKLENFLFSPEKIPQNLTAAVPRCSALPLLKLVLQQHSAGVLVAAFPDANHCDLAESELYELLKLVDIGRELKILVIPECGRGKLLFPGGESRRARALNRILNEKFDLILGSVHALLGAAPPPEESAEAQLELHQGMQISIAELLEKLVLLDYDDEAMVSVSGEFSHRGGIVDIFSPAHDEPCRIEFFGDEIDSMRIFSPDTQRSTGKTDVYKIINRAGITAGGAAESDAFAYLERSGEFHTVNFFPDAGVEVLQKYSVPGAVERWEELNKRCNISNFYETAQTDAALCPVLPPFAADTGLLPQHIRGKQEFIELELLKKQLRSISDGNGEIIFAVDSAEDIPALEKWCAETKLDAFKVEKVVSKLKNGFSIPGEKLLFLTDSELAKAGFRLVSRDIQNLEKSVETVELPAAVPSAIEDFSLSDFAEGDYVVHIDCGIAIYRGLKIQKSGEESREMLVLEFRDGQLLYVNPIQSSKISRYLGSPGRVKLHALNSSKWLKDKENARNGVRSYAADMLRFQAIRQAVPGIAFRADNNSVEAFRRAFPYKDTPCQSRSTIEIRNDMLKAKPMDRLLCGDVGYGKTEIAMRAAFRAVSAGYQVALIAPTTVLAQQHYRSFCERFREFPYTIDVVSRFRTAAEQQKIAEKLLSGGIDILIGTHRLCGNMFGFRNLGLVIIDEEQRFGVDQKERLRRFRVEADVLSMSATPIPRTLYLAMAGARDLSTLITPPKMRLPVKTVIAPEEDELIANAICAELARGGQVYYLHNRVRSIDECRKHLQELVPGAKIAVAHGQLPESELEQIMDDFACGKIDCLVCSTIIESGLDVPNANTIIIERADRFGLAQLYQLRGRVGRWKHQAYAYMLLPKNQLANTTARKRLAAIRRCSTLGAGFQLALRDLEIRGAGNLLGSEQSGHLCMIGFDLYCRLLKREIDRLQKTVPPGETAHIGEEELMEEIEINIEFLKVALKTPEGVMAAAFPESFISNENLRIAAYRRSAELRSEEALQNFKEELCDRYGKLPQEVENMIEYIRIRILAGKGKFRKLTVANGIVSLHRASGEIFRKDGKLPRIDPRDSLRMKLHHLITHLRSAL